MIGGLSILVVDDHSDSGHMLKRLLSMSGHHVVTAESCADALAITATLQFDCYLLDLGLPDGDGCDLLRQLLAQRAVPAAALTGYAFPADRERARAAGFAHVLVKPFDLEQVQQVIAGVAEATHPNPASDPSPPGGDWIHE
jgi:CheY-like chemotaxis protein